jgi:hypothetical protein
MLLLLRVSTLIPNRVNPLSINKWRCWGNSFDEPWLRPIVILFKKNKERFGSIAAVMKILAHLKMQSRFEQQEENWLTSFVL